eukprot:TRINITY_DN10804_c0_g1_i1.p1 TRINITY_DN10804_c0_g1~~TRINITY_DN10804_c0_g1_i1.p1  ORF type:complete len:251 (-),score=78.63 TRINITY_DN10804_c0_g1_i1:298-1050(-)
MGCFDCFACLNRPKLTTAFWNFRGLGAPMRMMCVYSGISEWNDIKFETKRKGNGNWTATEWEEKYKPVLKEHNPLVSLPYVINEKTGQVVSQSHAVYLYLGRLFDLNGKTEEEILANEQVLCHLHTVWMELRDLVYPFKNNRSEEEFKSSLQGHFQTTLPAHYDKLEAWLKHKNADYFAGRKPCTADFHVWEMLDQQEKMASQFEYPSPLENYDLLKAFFSRFREHPRLRKYFDGDDAKLPMNNKMAYFK